MEKASVFSKNKVVTANSIINKNKLAVKTGNSHQLMNSTGGISASGFTEKYANAALAKNKDAVDSISENLTQSLTNFSKTKDNADSVAVQRPPRIPEKLANLNSKSRKVKLLPNLFDDSRVSPKRGTGL